MGILGRFFSRCIGAATRQQHHESQPTAGVRQGDSSKETGGQQQLHAPNQDQGIWSQPSQPKRQNVNLPMRRSGGGIHPLCTTAELVNGDDPVVLLEFVGAECECAKLGLTLLERFKSSQGIYLNINFCGVLPHESFDVCRRAMHAAYRNCRAVRLLPRYANTALRSLLCCPSPAHYEALLAELLTSEPLLLAALKDICISLVEGTAAVGMGLGMWTGPVSLHPAGVISGIGAAHPIIVQHPLPDSTTRLLLPLTIYPVIVRRAVDAAASTSTIATDPQQQQNHASNNEILPELRKLQQQQQPPQPQILAAVMLRYGLSDGVRAMHEQFHRCLTALSRLPSSVTLLSADGRTVLYQNTGSVRYMGLRQGLMPIMTAGTARRPARSRGTAAAAAAAATVTATARSHKGDNNMNASAGDGDSQGDTTAGVTAGSSSTSLDGGGGRGSSCGLLGKFGLGSCKKNEDGLQKEGKKWDAAHADNGLGANGDPTGGARNNRGLNGCSGGGEGVLWELFTLCPQQWPEVVSELAARGRWKGIVRVPHLLTQHVAAEMAVSSTEAAEAEARQQSDAMHATCVGIGGNTSAADEATAVSGSATLEQLPGAVVGLYSRHRPTSYWNQVLDFEASWERLMLLHPVPASALTDLAVLPRPACQTATAPTHTTTTTAVATAIAAAALGPATVPPLETHAPVGMSTCGYNSSDSVAALHHISAPGVQFWSGLARASTSAAATTSRATVLEAASASATTVSDGAAGSSLSASQSSCLQKAFMLNKRIRSNAESFGGPTRTTVMPAVPEATAATTDEDESLLMILLQGATTTPAATSNIASSQFAMGSAPLQNIDMVYGTNFKGSFASVRTAASRLAPNQPGGLAITGGGGGQISPTSCTPIMSHVMLSEDAPNGSSCTSLRARSPVQGGRSTRGGTSGKRSSLDAMGAGAALPRIAATGSAKGLLGVAAVAAAAGSELENNDCTGTRSLELCSGHSSSQHQRSLWPSQQTSSLGADAVIVSRGGPFPDGQQQGGPAGDSVSATASRNGSYRGGAQQQNIQNILLNPLSQTTTATAADTIDMGRASSTSGMGAAGGRTTGHVLSPPLRRSIELRRNALGICRTFTGSSSASSRACGGSIGASENPLSTSTWALLAADGHCCTGRGGNHLPRRNTSFGAAILRAGGHPQQQQYQPSTPPTQQQLIDARIAMESPPSRPWPCEVDVARSCRSTTGMKALPIIPAGTMVTSNSTSRGGCARPFTSPRPFCGVKKIEAAGGDVHWNNDPEVALVEAGPQRQTPPPPLNVAQSMEGIREMQGSRMPIDKRATTNDKMLEPNMELVSSSGPDRMSSSSCASGDLLVRSNTILSTAMATVAAVLPDCEPVKSQQEPRLLAINRSGPSSCRHAPASQAQEVIPEVTLLKTSLLEMELAVSRALSAASSGATLLRHIENRPGDLYASFPRMSTSNTMPTSMLECSSLRLGNHEQCHQELIAEICTQIQGMDPAIGQEWEELQQQKEQHQHMEISKGMEVDLVADATAVHMPAMVITTCCVHQGKAAALLAAPSGSGSTSNGQVKAGAEDHVAQGDDVLQEGGFGPAPNAGPQLEKEQQQRDRVGLREEPLDQRGGSRADVEGHAASHPSDGHDESSGDNGGKGRSNNCHNNPELNDRTNNGNNGGDYVQKYDDGDSEEDSSGSSCCWHEVSITLLDGDCKAAAGVNDEPMLLLMQTDVTARVRAERRIARVLEAEHQLLESIFPRHVLELAATTAQNGDDRGGGAARYRLAQLPLPQNSASTATYHPMVTVLFADIKGFTSLCHQIPATRVMDFLNNLYSRLDTLLDVYGVYKVETIGDCYMVAGGLMIRDADGFMAVRGPGSVDELHAAKVMAFAKAMLREASRVLLPTTRRPVEMRIGLHSGPVMSGIVGSKMPRFCLFGDTVNTASRMESTCTPGSIHVSATTAALLPAEEWEPTGGVQVKGLGVMSTFRWQGDLLEHERTSLGLGVGKGSDSGILATAAAALVAHPKNGVVGVIKRTSAATLRTVRPRRASTTVVLSATASSKGIGTYS
ncbi:hypothetical protein VaNZ11_006256 [Volvox africanus]|uniref:Guanylate cyclase domain-containing protein n=1 Tax=Volvox africanus TaxID=51714 RepID=A0ABQ5S239_9CHLO|nr:hypothetical protein VaNZ11_006256 [Volvox africanus]